MAFSTEEKYIIKAEEQLSVKFPPKFRNRLMNDNGGEIETEEDSWRLFPVFDNSDKKRMGRTANHIVRENQVVKECNGFSDDALAIADCGDGNYCVLLKDSTGEYTDVLYLWSHETGEVEEIAESIEELEE